MSLLRRRSIRERLISWEETSEVAQMRWAAIIRNNYVFGIFSFSKLWQRYGQEPLIKSLLRRSVPACFD